MTAALVEHLAARPDVALVAYAITRDRTIGPQLALPPGTPLRVTGVPARVLFDLWRRVPAPGIERWTDRVDVVHGTNFVVPPTRSAALVTVHDVAFARRPELVTPASRRYTGLLRVAVQRGASVQVFSDTVRDEVLGLLGCPTERVVRIHPGIATTDVGDATAGRRLARSERYVLALGTVEPRKNYPRLVAAFDRLAGPDPDLHLVIAGVDGWGVEELTDAIEAATHRARVIRLGYVSDGDRADLLAGASVLAYPSLDEGFGHPPLEAMRARTPVVAARAGALPEVLGDAALLVDPSSVDDLANGLAAVLHDDATRARLVAAGAERVGRFGWQAAADAFVDCYRRLSERDAGARARDR